MASLTPNEIAALARKVDRLESVLEGLIERFELLESKQSSTKSTPSKAKKSSSKKVAVVDEANINVVDNTATETPDQSE